MKTLKNLSAVVLIIVLFFGITTTTTSCGDEPIIDTTTVDTTDIDTVPVDTTDVDTTVIDSGSAPVAYDVIENIEKNGTVLITITDHVSDVDDNISGITVNLMGNSNVQVVIDGNNITITSSNDYLGVITGTYTVTDTKNNKTTGDITINIGNAKQIATYSLISKYFGEDMFYDNDLILTNNTINLRVQSFEFIGLNELTAVYMINDNGEITLTYNGTPYKYYTISTDSSIVYGNTIYLLRFSEVNSTLTISFDLN